jgi:hypothetical protein
VSTGAVQERQVDPAEKSSHPVPGLLNTVAPTITL